MFREDKELIVANPLADQPCETENPVVELLTKAKQLISKRENWCRFYSSRVTPEGVPQHCAVGALAAVSRGASVYRRDAQECLGRSLPMRPSFNAVSVVMYNDSEYTRHADIMALFNRAIELARRSA